MLYLILIIFITIIFFIDMKNKKLNGKISNLNTNEILND